MPMLEDLAINNRCFQNCRNAVIEGLPLLKSEHTDRKSTRLNSSHMHDTK